MAGPDPAAMKKGEEMGKASAKPVGRYIRPADPITVPPIPLQTSKLPFFHSPGNGKTKRFGIVVGAATLSNSSIKFQIHQNGTKILEVELGNWQPEVVIELSTDEITVEEDDVFTATVQNATTTFLPALMLFVQVNLGE